ncbi:anti-sigma factor [Streptomyces fildesensis]|uniref:Anti-sigma factor n=1 Tax=Streptomyces fildesensis TaxID=375757 RepID=A0ABW8C5W6_9ACTN
MNAPDQAPRTPGSVLAVHVDDVPTTEIGPGILLRELPGPAPFTFWVVDFAPGSRWPGVDVHETVGEGYFVAEGEVIEGDLRHGPGTYVLLEQGSSHRPRSETGARVFGYNHPAG